MVVQPSLPGRAKWASDLIERLEHSQRGIVRGLKTTGDMVLQKKPVDRWLLVPGLALGVGLLLLVALTMPLPRSRRPGWRRVWAGRAGYALSVVNPFFSVLANDYTFVRDAKRSYILAIKGGAPAVDNSEKLRQLVTGVGAVKPRRLLVLGAVLRGVQLHSSLHRLFDPPASFGLGVNMLALIDGVAWPASLLLGWALSAPWWRLGQAGHMAGPGLSAEVGGARESNDLRYGGTRGAAANGTVTGSAPERAAHPGVVQPGHGHFQEQAAAHAVPRRGLVSGLVLTLHLPTVHLAAIAVGFLALTEKMRALRWTLMLILAQTRASFARAGPGT